MKTNRLVKVSILTTIIIVSGVILGLCFSLIDFGGASPTSQKTNSGTHTQNPNQTGNLGQTVAPTTPAHHWSWSYDANQHWAICTDEGCDQEIAPQDHTWEVVTSNNGMYEVVVCPKCGCHQTREACGVTFLLLDSHGERLNDGCNILIYKTGDYTSQDAVFTYVQSGAYVRARNSVTGENSSDGTGQITFRIVFGDNTNYVVSEVFEVGNTPCLGHLTAINSTTYCADAISGNTMIVVTVHTN